MLVFELFRLLTCSFSIAFVLVFFPLFKGIHLFCPILSYSVLSYPILSYPVLFFPILSWGILKLRRHVAMLFTFWTPFFFIVWRVPSSSVYRRILFRYLGIIVVIFSSCLSHPATQSSRGSDLLYPYTI